MEGGAERGRDKELREVVKSGGGDERVLKVEGVPRMVRQGVFLMEWESGSRMHRYSCTQYGTHSSSRQLYHLTFSLSSTAYFLLHSYPIEQTLAIQHAR